jgi:S-DNA-T family DNA segregation ATPase FtsK/SpoIIIE
VLSRGTFTRKLNYIFSRLAHYLVGGGFLALALMAAVAIFSYKTTDPSFNTVTGLPPNNIAGPVGAYLSDFLWQSLGAASFLPIVFLSIVGVKTILDRPMPFVAARLSLMILLLPALSLTLALLFSNSQELLPDLGGFIGKFLKNEFLIRFELWPGAIIFIILAFIAVIASLPLTWSEMKTTFIFIGQLILIILGLILWVVKFTLTLLYKGFMKFKGKEVAIKLDSPKVKLAKKNKVTERDQAPENVKKLAKAHIQDTLRLEPGEFELPPVNLLTEAPQVNKQKVSQDALNQNSKILHQVLQDFGVKGDINNISPGPVVTLYELEPSAGTKSSRVIGLADDIARSMSAVSARIAVVPGKNALGIELPNAQRQTVYLREMLEAIAYQESGMKLPLVLGKDIGGAPVIADLAKMPHLLVAGTTGSGKSVAINTMILSLLYRHSPKTCRFIMVDPKMLELSVYEGIPHLLAPVVTDPKKAIIALKWVVKEMENRYRAMSTMGVRNIAGYNKVLEDLNKKGEKLQRRIQTGFDPETGKPLFETVEMSTEPLPFIVVIVDEMADLMLVAGKDIEASIQRLAQMARAAGIHLIMATQRPSVDVITGVIKANFPTRISFQVTSKIDSRTILGEQGAEQLLGMGDMLYMAGGGKIIRVHGPFVSDNEVEGVVNFLKAQGSPQYSENITVGDEGEEDIPVADSGAGGRMPEDTEALATLRTFGISASGDPIYDRAVAVVLKDRKPTTSYIQRVLKVGYNKAANLIERMEKEGILSEPSHTGKRHILVGEDRE